MQKLFNFFVWLICPPLHSMYYAGRFMFGFSRFTLVIRAALAVRLSA